MAKAKLTILEVLRNLLVALIAQAEEAGITTEELFEGFVDSEEEDSEEEDSEEEEEEEATPTDFIEALTDLDELKTIAKELGITAGKKALEALKKEILKKDEDTIVEALTELGYMEADEEEDSEEESEEDEVDLEAIRESLSELALADLKALATEHEITVKKGAKADAIIDSFIKAIEDGELDAEALFESEEEEEESEEDEDSEEDSEEITEEDVLGLLDECSVDELKTLAKALKIKLDVKDKEKAIIKKVMAKDLETVVEALESTGLIETE
jgi:hypothetical protein